MSLTGNLEDLPLLDILQIVSFSKKTGFLSIQAAGGSSAIVFRDGFEVSAFTSLTRPLAESERRLPPEARLRRVRERIELALKHLIRLRDGEFNFSLAEEPPTVVDGRDVAEETLESGINAQELLLGLARGLDEDRRDSAAALEASFAEAPPLPAEPASFDEDLETPAVPPPASVPVPAPVEAPAAAPAAEPRAVILVDDEADVRAMLAEHITRGGFQVLEAEDPETAAKKASQLAKAGVDFVLVTDLGMPTSGGASFHGGFEVVKRLWKANLKPPVLLMTETLNGAVQARARQMGITNIVFKPGLSKLDPRQFAADIRAFAHKLVTDVLPRIEAPAPAPARPSAGPAAAGQPGPPRAGATAEEVARDFETLQERLEELRQGGEPSQIASLVMKAARDVFERALLLVVKGEDLRGVGGFGRAPRESSLTVLVREVAIPLGSPSVFAEVVVARRPRVGELPDGDRWVQHLLGKIGRFRTTSAALLPLLTNREAVAVLFGDNPETGRPPGRVDALTVFMNQAGVALENAFLQRKVSALQKGESP
jgi:CheY-like chemotaxis protein